MAVHFVNFRDEARFQNAARVFGQPDFIHVRWDARAKFGGEFDPETDIIVFAKGDEHDDPCVFTFDDSAHA